MKNIKKMTEQEIYKKGYRDAIKNVCDAIEQIWITSGFSAAEFKNTLERYLKGEISL